VPLALLFTLIFIAALALGLSALQVFLRDTREFVTMFFSIGLFLHPILYLPNAIPAAVRGVVYASPVSYFLFCWQDVLFFGGFHRPWAWAIAAAIALFSFIFSARLFMSSKAHFGEFL
jgi:lipopolysaccharide transport system permease protein